ncbi:Septum formation protein Maf [Limihaloglobus sulfuriphilus]|uniref:dTTP/UTP pyrophosphatase n=1 Tax=Limihaloglobus sulfuriphilus TaxID=1851148 RepID=A0A1Q2MGG9_9BACT|nr:nucleoside triphosphate pyrophosphatase [Limihaloglobus sulfuriphilus]AQQ71781.1 Septum formation protein Maf [Limihaloglobus sulfuriphilus]
MSKNNEPFILASSSPRRSELLKEAGYEFEVLPSGIDENAYPADGLSVFEYASILAKAKAFAVALKHPGRLVLGADSIVRQDDSIIGKPADAKDADSIIRRLFASPHELVSAVAFICIDTGTELIDTDVTTVYPKKISEDNIVDYVKSGDWKGKAGAYGIQDPQSDKFIERIEGSFTNVMGLPMEKTSRYLDRLLRLRTQ